MYKSQNQRFSLMSGPRNQDLTSAVVSDCESVRERGVKSKDTDGKGIREGR